MVGLFVNGARPQTGGGGGVYGPAFWAWLTAAVILTGIMGWMSVGIASENIRRLKEGWEGLRGRKKGKGEEVRKGEEGRKGLKLGKGKGTCVEVRGKGG